MKELGYGDTSFLKQEEEEDYWFLDYIYLQTINKKAAEMVSVKLSEGRLPENENEIILQKDILKRYNNEGNLVREYKVGDQLTFTVGDRLVNGEKVYGNPWGKNGQNGEEYVSRYERTYTIVGVLESWGNTNSGGGGSDAFTGEAVEKKHAKEDQDAACSVYAKLKNPYHVNSVFRQLKRDGVYKNIFGTNESVLKWMGASVNRAFTVLLGGIFGILITIVAAGSVFLIYNAFAISLRERTTQFGILASVGATKKQIRRSMLYEAVTAGGIGIPLGMVSGVVGIGITLHYIGPWIAAWIHGVNGKIELYISPVIVIGTAGIVVVILGISAWIPVRRIRHMAPLAAIRATQDIKIQAKQVRTPKYVQKIFGLEGLLADKNFKRDKKRHKATILSLVASFVLFTSASLLSEYLVRTGGEVMQVPEYEILYQVNAPKNGESQSPEEIMQRIQETGKAERIESYRSQTAMLKMDEIVLTAEIVVLPDEEYRKYAKHGEIIYDDLDTSYDPSAEKYISQNWLMKKNDAEVKLEWMESYMDDEGEFKEEVKGSKEVKLNRAVEKVPDYVDSWSNVTIFVPESREEEFLLADENVKYVFAVKTQEYNQLGEELDEMLAKGTLKEGIIANLGSDYEMRRGILIAVRVLTLGFTVLISLIAAANVFNTISTNVLLRKREFAMLRSMGMAQRMINKMLRYESMIYVIRASVYGIIGTLLVNYWIYWQVGMGAQVMGIIIPWKEILIAAAWVALVVYATMMYTGARLKDENIMEELKKE